MPNVIKWQQKSLSYIFNVSSTNISFLLYYKPPLPHVRADLQSARIQYSIINVFAIHRHFKCLHSLYSLSFPTCTCERIANPSEHKRKFINNLQG